MSAVKKRISEVKVYHELSLAYLYFDNVALISPLMEGEISDSRGDKVTRAITLCNKVTSTEVKAPISAFEIGRTQNNLRVVWKVANDNKD